MQKLMKAMHKNEKGFTLVELMVVVVIIGVLVAIAIPIYGTVTENAANRSHEANIRTLIGAANMAFSEGAPENDVTWETNGDVSVNGNDVEADWHWDNYLEDYPTVPSAATLAAGDAEVPVTGDAQNDQEQNYEVTIEPSGDITVEVK